MSCVRGAFSRYNFSEEVTDVLLTSLRSGTQKQYQTYLNKWMAFCGERKIAPLNEALQFVVQLFNQGLNYSHGCIAWVHQPFEVSWDLPLLVL